MTLALLAAALVVAAAVVAGCSVAPLLDRRWPPIATGAVVGLGVLIVASTDLAVVWRFDPRCTALAWLAMVVVPPLAQRRMPWNRSMVRPGDALVVASLALIVPMLVFPVPLDTDAQGFGQLALAIRESGTLDTLAPWRPEIAYLYSPGALELCAFVSRLLPRLDMAAVMMGVGHAAAFLFIWVAGEFGEQLALASLVPERVEDAAARATSWTRLARLCALFSAGLWTALLDAHYTTIVALVLLLGFCTMLLRAARTARPADTIAAGVLLAAIPITHSDTAVIAALFGVSVIAAGLADGRMPGARTLARRLVGAGIVAIVLAAPWLLSLRPLMATGVESPYVHALTNWRPLVLYNGIIWPLLAVPGAIAARRLRLPWALPMALWMLLVIELGVTGLLQRAVPGVMLPILKFNYPFSVAWHGPIVPCLGLAVAALGATRVARAAVPRWAMPTAVVLMAAAVLFAQPVLRQTHGMLRLQGAFSTAHDVEAMRWIRANTPRHARVLNYPGDQEHGLDWEAHWAPVITERDCVYFRMQLFFSPRVDSARADVDAVAAARKEQHALVSFWRDPADPANGERLRRSGIDYVLVPESVADADSTTSRWRWQPPLLVTDTRSTPSDAPYLKLVFASGGAQVYAVGAEHS